MIHLMLKHITYKNSLSKVITKSFHPSEDDDKAEGTKFKS